MQRAMLRGTAILFVLACVAPAAAGAQGFAYDLGANGATVQEADTTVEATVVFRRSSTFPVPARTYRVTAFGGSADGPQDYEPLVQYVKLPALVSGTQTVPVKVRIVGDLYPEPIEQVYVEFSSGVTFDWTLAVVTIIDTPDAAPPAGRTATTYGRIPQQLFSRAADGGVPNAPASDPVLSWDARSTRFGAYVSRATNIASGTNGRRNVFLVKRGGTPGRFGSPWEYGSTALASKGRGAKPANGDSWGPDLGGWVHVDDARGPICLAFVSKASNLVRGDRNRRADVFVRRASGGRLRRIAAPRGRNATEAAISGNCRVTGLVAGGALYVTKRGSRKLRRVARGGVREPRLSFNGGGVSYARKGIVYARRTGGRERRIGKGSRPTSDGGASGHGAIRAVSFERAGGVYRANVGNKAKLVTPGVAPSMTAGGAQVMFAFGPFLYLYASSNNFGKQRPQGLCPPSQGRVVDVYTSARGNYVVYTCAGGQIHLSYIGPK